MHYYVSPRLRCRAKLFLSDDSGKFIEWESDDDCGVGRLEITLDRRDRRILTISDSDYEISSCRETMLNNISTFFETEEYCLVPVDRCIRLSPPRGIRETLEIQLEVDGATKATQTMGVDRDEATLLAGLYKLGTSPSQQRKLFKLMDYVLGTAAMLMESPRAYVRTGTNPLPEPVQPWTEIGHEFNEKTGVEKPIIGKNIAIWLSYNGVSNAMLKTPEHLSIITGLARWCLELVVEGEYDNIDNEVDISAVRARLRQLKRRKQLDKSEQGELLYYLKLMKPWWSTPKVKANPGAYPLNQYTWGMFKLYINDDSTASMSSRWVRTGNIYGDFNGGFYTWCRSHKKKTAAFKNRPRSSSWTGTADQSVNTNSDW